MYAVRAEWKKFCTFREVYVGLGLTMGLWSTAWWVFPVGGILCGIVNVALDPYKGED